MRKVLILVLSIAAVACDAGEPIESHVAQYTPELQRVAQEFRVEDPEDPCFDYGTLGCPCIHGHCWEGECVGVAYDDDGYIEDYGVCEPTEDDKEAPAADDLPTDFRTPTCPTEPSSPQPEWCEQGDSVVYVSESPEKCECSDMHIHCAPGWEMFSNECGCGCVEG